MFRLAFMLYSIIAIAIALAGTGVIAVLVMGCATLCPILITAASGGSSRCRWCHL